jgi:predicted nucleic acid-binding protein
MQAGLNVLGTLAVLERAYEAKLISDLAMAIKELRLAGGRIDDDAILKVLRRCQLTELSPLDQEGL